MSISWVYGVKKIGLKYVTHSYTTTFKNEKYFSSYAERNCWLDVEFPNEESAQAEADKLNSVGKIMHS